MPLGSHSALPPSTPKHVTDQPCLPENPGAEPAGTTQYGTNWLEPTGGDWKQWGVALLWNYKLRARGGGACEGTGSSPQAIIWRHLLYITVPASSHPDPSTLSPLLGLNRSSHTQSRQSQLLQAPPRVFVLSVPSTQKHFH